MENGNRVASSVMAAIELSQLHRWRILDGVDVDEGKKEIRASGI